MPSRRRRLDSVGPFGNPDGSRADIDDVISEFVDFGGDPAFGHLATRANDSMVRVIVGKLGAGKTVYLRRLQDFQSRQDSVYADVPQQGLPKTEVVVKACQWFSDRVLVEKWMQIWERAIMRSLASHLLHRPELRQQIADEQADELERSYARLLDEVRRPRSIYSEVRDIINRQNNAHQLSTYLDDPLWDDLEDLLGEVVNRCKPIYFYLDALDEEFSHAPMYWLKCQEGLFYQVMRLLRDHKLGGRLHVVICIRDIVMSSVYRSEHAPRYYNEPHIRVLTWDRNSLLYLLQKKLQRLPPALLMRRVASGPPTIGDWLGVNGHWPGPDGDGPIEDYLLSHTRLIPRDIISLGNDLNEEVLRQKQAGHDGLSAEVLAKVVQRCAKRFGDSQLAQCANQISSDLMPKNAALHDYSELFTSTQAYISGVHEDVRSFVRMIGVDRFPRADLSALQEMADLHFEQATDLASVLWQNGLLGYLDESGRRRFYSIGDIEEFHFPPEVDTYVLHPCLVHAVGGIRHVRADVTGAAEVRGTRPLPSAERSDHAEVSAAAPPSGGSQALPNPYPAQVRPSGATRAAIYAVGDVLEDRFEILGLLGQGGFSKVYRVRDEVEGEERALKLFDSTAGDEAVRREIGALRKIRHPNVVEVFWAGKTGAGEWYLVTEFVDGESLDEFVTGNRHLRDREAVDVALDLLDALVAFHPDSARLKQLDAKRRDGVLTEAESQIWTELNDKGLVHRDIKPLNVMLTRTGAKLLDFNIASRVGDPVHTRSGTPPYQPPDVGRDRWDVSTDLFAVGVLLYRLLCNGQHPFPDAMPTTDGPVTDPRTIRPDLNPDLAGFLIRACAPASADRFSTAAEMQLALRNIRTGLLSGGLPLPSAMNSDRQGLQVFASGTGRVLRSLVSDKSASLPQVSGGSVYYDIDGPAGNCSVIMRVPYHGGTPVVVHRFGPAAGEDAFAVSRDGRMLAYAWSRWPQVPRYPCSPQSPSFLTVVNLATGQSHTMSGFPDGVSSLAWSADDQHLVFDFVARQDSSEAEVLANPFRNAVYHPGRPLPCPDGVRFCAEFTPQYDQAGHIVFLACLQPYASTCRFVLAETTGSRSAALASSVGLARNQGGGWSTIDSAGNAAIFTAPRGDGWATYRWTSGHVVRLSRPVEQPDW